jgi:hypothetical protein
MKEDLNKTEHSIQQLLIHWLQAQISQELKQLSIITK